MLRLLLILTLVVLLLVVLYVGITWAAPPTRRPAQVGEAAITFQVSLPPETPAGDTIYVAGSFQGWDPGGTPMKRTGDTASLTITFTVGTRLEYKYTRGAWTRVEKDEQCGELANRTAVVLTSDTYSDTVAHWADLPPCGVGSEPTGTSDYDARAQKVVIASEVLSVTKAFYVYTPPGYAEETWRRYPVLYLFRGHEREWVNKFEDPSRGGRNVIDVYEELLAAGEVGPMMLVFPGISSADNSISGLLTDFQRPDLVEDRFSDTVAVGTGLFESYFVDEIIPYVDTHYRTVADRSRRGVDGFSLGGFMSAKIAARYPELFSTSGGFDGTYLYADPTCETISPQDTLFYNPQNDWLYGPAFGPWPHDGAYAAANNAPNIVCNSTPAAMQSILWLVQYGALTSEPNDSNYRRGLHFQQQLEEKGVENAIESVLPGGHNWATADEHMRQTLPLHWAAFAQGLPSGTPTSTAVATPTTTATPARSPTVVASLTSTALPSAAATITPRPSGTATAEGTASPTPTRRPDLSPTVTNSDTASPSPSAPGTRAPVATTTATPDSAETPGRRYYLPLVRR